jgi:hypothetical protein
VGYYEIKLLYTINLQKKNKCICINNKLENGLMFLS